MAKVLPPSGSVDVQDQLESPRLACRWMSSTTAVLDACQARNDSGSLTPSFTGLVTVVMTLDRAGREWTPAETQGVDAPEPTPSDKPPRMPANDHVGWHEIAVEISGKSRFICTKMRFQQRAS